MKTGEFRALNLRAKAGREARNHPLIAERKIIGRGYYAAVFQGKAADCIYKLTLDYAQHAIAFVPELTIDSAYVPRAIQSFGPVGRQRKKPIYLMEVEKLTSLAHTRHRAEVSLAYKMTRFHRKWLWERREGRRDDYRLYDRLALSEAMKQPFMPDFIKPALERMIEVVSFGDFVIDMKVSNFMMREATGEIVMNDLICDGWHVASNPMAYA